MTIPEALARVERLRDWYRDNAETLTERQVESAAALTLILSEAHRAQRLREALQSIANSSCCDRCQEAALVARAALSGRCEGRYVVPQTSPRRDEPFDVTYRCGLIEGHAGPHAAALEAPDDK